MMLCTSLIVANLGASIGFEVQGRKFKGLRCGVQGPTYSGLRRFEKQWWFLDLSKAMSQYHECRSWLARDCKVRDEARTDNTQSMMLEAELVD